MFAQYQHTPSSSTHQLGRSPGPYPSTSGGLHHQYPQVVTPMVTLYDHHTIPIALLTLPEPRRQDHSQHHDVDRTNDESVNRINVGRGSPELGIMPAPEGAMNLVFGLTETPESPHPTLTPPTDRPHCDLNPQPLTCAPTTEHHRQGPAAPQVSKKKRPRSRKADACASPNQDPQGETSSGERPTKVRKLDKRHEREATKVLEEWKEFKTTKKLGNGEDVGFGGFIRSQETYDDISTKLLRCLEPNCPSITAYTRFSNLKDHVIKQHFVKKVVMRDSETAKSPSFLDRVAAAKKEGEVKVSGEDYLALKAAYKSLKELVKPQAERKFIQHVIRRAST